MAHYITSAQIKEMAEAVLSAHEVSPLSHARKCEVAMEHAADEYGISPRITAVLVAVNLANLGWHGLSIATKQAIEEQSA